jgi:uncharacterized protein YeeX (DUF496 family)
MNNNKITLEDVRSEAMTTIKQLREGSIKNDVAKEIRENLNTIVDTAKCQVDFLKALPERVRETMTLDDILGIAASYTDDDKELDRSLREIKRKNEERNQEPYNLSK